MFGKFILSTRTDGHNFYFANFLLVCTRAGQKAGSLAFQHEHFVTEKVAKVARTDEQIKLVT